MAVRIKQIETRIATPGRFLNAMLEAKGFETDKQLAEHIGVTAQAIGNVRRGESMISGWMVFQCAEVTGLPIEKVLALGNLKPEVFGNAWPTPITERFIVAAAYQMNIPLNQAKDLFGYTRK